MSSSWGSTTYCRIRTRKTLAAQRPPRWSTIWWFRMPRSIGRGGWRILLLSRCG